MTDRFHSFTVVLDKDVREDDAEDTINAIKQIRGVLSVEGNVADIDSHVAEERVHRELGKKLMAVIYPPPKR